MVARQALKTDVLTVGAGPAGLAAAIAASQKGLRVTIADAAHPPIDKACGEGLMPDGVRALNQLGISIRSCDSFPLRGIRLAGDAVSVHATFPNGIGFGVRRTTLHQALAERASELGVRILWGARVRASEGEPLSVDGQPAQYTWLIGADGRNSQLRRWAGLDGGHMSSMRFGFRRHYRIEPWTDHVEVHWGQHGEIFVTPVARNEVCVALISQNSQLRLDDALPSFPNVYRYVGKARPTSMERGGVSETRSLQVVARNRVALVGDASGTVDALTGEGLCLAFQQAVALAEALSQENLALYRAAHTRIIRIPTFMARLMVTMDRRPWLQRRVLQGLAAEPGIFSRVLAVHLGALPPSALGVRGVATLGWRLLTV